MGGLHNVCAFWSSVRELHEREVSEVTRASVRCYSQTPTRNPVLLWVLPVGGSENIASQARDCIKN